MELNGAKFENPVFFDSNSWAWGFNGKTGRLLRRASRGATFTTRVTTLGPCGEPLDDGYRPGRFFCNPQEIRSPGMAALLANAGWKERKEPFIISVTSVAQASDRRVGELRSAVELLQRWLRSFKTSAVGLELNFCQRTEDWDILIDEAFQSLEATSQLRMATNGVSVPIVVKVNTATPLISAVSIAARPECSALCVRSMPFDRPSLTRLLEWLEQARRIGVKKPIIAGGGIVSPTDAWHVMEAGASGILLGSEVATFRLWKIPAIIEAVGNYTFTQSNGCPFSRGQDTP